MKKFLSILLVVCMIISLLAACGGVSQEEYDALEKSNEILSGLSQEYAEQLKNAETEKYMLKGSVFADAAAKISPDALCAGMGEKYVQIIVPLGDNTIEAIVEKITENVLYIVASFEVVGYESCFLTIVDDNDDCIMGFSIKPDGTNSVYAGSSILD